MFDKPMRVSTLLPLLFSAAFFQGCIDEEPVPINFRVKEKPLLDTTYITAAPAAQDKHVILYDITGVRCNNCPQAADKAKQIEAARGGKVHVLATYITPMPNLTAPWRGYDTLTTPIADQMIAATGVSVNSLPNGMVDQAVFGSSRVISMNEWEARVSERLGETTPVNIELSSSWDAAKKEAVITLKMVYNSDKATENHRYTIALTEGGIVGKQSDKDTAGGIRYYYTHNHVLRTTITAPGGDLLTEPLVAGRVFEKQYRYKPAANFKPANMHVVAFVQRDSDRVILNGRETDLIP
jgi:hypothetical protein